MPPASQTARTGARLRGIFAPPGDKSLSHRAALFSLLAEGEIEVENMSPCADVAASLGAVRALGGRVETRNGLLVLSGLAGGLLPRTTIHCANSGTTMRLLAGICAGSPGEYLMDGDNSLRRRPMERVAEPLRRMGANVACAPGGACPLTIRGGALRGIDYALPVASAQLKSAVLLAGIQAGGRTRVREAVPSRDHTERLLSLCGARIRCAPGETEVERSRLLFPPSLFIPGDASSAAFFLCAAAVMPGSDVTAEGVLLNPHRTGFLRVLERMGARVEVEVSGGAPEPFGQARVRYAGGLRGTVVAPEEIPSLVDEVPILALVATQAEGVTEFRGAGELRVKESDRLGAIAGELSRMGADIRVEGDTLLVTGPARLSAPPALCSFSDHRMAMTLRLASVLAGGDPEIEDEACCAVSYPDFRETLTRLLS